MSDISRVRKHITLLIDKLSQGAQIPQINTADVTSIDQKKKKSASATAAAVKMNSAVSSQPLSMLSRPAAKALETIIEDTSVADANDDAGDAQLGDAAVPLGARVFARMKTGTLQAVRSTHRRQQHSTIQLRRWVLHTTTPKC
jgi:hypothetical protein